jgi:hypothetical protein
LRLSKQKHRAGDQAYTVLRKNIAKFPLPSGEGKGILVLRCEEIRCVGGPVTCAGGKKLALLSTAAIFVSQVL